jgi:Zn finger protein HypA/HybF involved in hydrogenase expression
MHDLHVADKILKLALEEGKKNNLKTITKIKVELGQVVEHGQRISPANLKFNIKMLAKGGMAEKAEVIIRSMKGNSFVLKEIYGND